MRSRAKQGVGGFRHPCRKVVTYSSGQMITAYEPIAIERALLFLRKVPGVYAIAAELKQARKAAREAEGAAA